MASRLFDDAKKAMTAGRFEEACPKYSESQRLDPQLGTLLHLAECYEKSGKTASAWASFRDASEIAQQRADARESKIRERVAALEKTMPSLVIGVAEGEPADIEVRQDGNVVGKAMWGSAAPVDPGAHTITAAAAGRKTWSSTLQISANGQATHVNVPMLEVDPSAQTAGAPAPVQPVAAAPAAPASATNADSGPASSSSGSTQRIVGWSLVGGGAVGLGIGIVFELQRGSKLSDRDALCPGGSCTAANTDQKARIDSLTSDAKSAGTIGVVGLVAGGLLAAGGLALVFTAPSGSPATSTAFVPIVGPGFHGIAVSGRM